MERSPLLEETYEYLFSHRFHPAEMKRDLEFMGVWGTRRRGEISEIRPDFHKIREMTPDERSGSVEALQRMPRAF